MILTGSMPLGSLISFKRFETMTDFPVPLGPVTYTYFPMSRSCSVIYEYLTVSMVYTTKLKYCTLGSNTNSGVFSLHGLNEISIGSK